MISFEKCNVNVVWPAASFTTQVYSVCKFTFSKIPTPYTISKRVKKHFLLCVTGLAFSYLRCTGVFNIFSYYCPTSTRECIFAAVPLQTCCKAFVEQTGLWNTNPYFNKSLLCRNRVVLVMVQSDNPPEVLLISSWENCMIFLEELLAWWDKISNAKPKAPVARP